MAASAVGIQHFAGLGQTRLILLPGGKQPIIGIGHKSELGQLQMSHLQNLTEGAIDMFNIAGPGTVSIDDIIDRCLFAVEGRSIAAHRPRADIIATDIHNDTAFWIPQQAVDAAHLGRCIHELLFKVEVDAQGLHLFRQVTRAEQGLCHIQIEEMHG